VRGAAADLLPGAPLRTAVVTGANRGIGFEVARQLGGAGFSVVLGARDGARGDEAAARLREEGLHVRAAQLDVAAPASVAAFAAGLGACDVLVNNAATNYDPGERAVTADLDVVRETLETNLLGAWRVTQALLPLLERSPHPRVVMVSSGGGSLTGMSGGSPAYGISKAALNALTLKLADELRGSRVLVNAACPGWTATDMGGRGGRPVAKGAASITWAALLPDDGPTGGFFRDGRRLEW
jgi:NAD(P)-dependent dehydrogenase (short-subunit alcohol dehydrogenase family)